MNKQRIFWGLGLLACLLGLRDASAEAVHRRGCDYPLKGVSVCWEATGDPDLPFAPFKELHLLPVGWQRGGNEEILGDYTRTLYRQFLPGNLATDLIQEWRPAFTLEQAMALVRKEQWPAALWVVPRLLRESSATSSGVVDWELHFISGEKGVHPLRTMRVRVESLPEVKRTNKENVATLGGMALVTPLAITAPVQTLGALVAADALSKDKPPLAGQPLELLTELAARQVMQVVQYPMDELANRPVAGPPQEKSLGTQAADWTRERLTHPPDPRYLLQPQPANGHP
ncbi:MAG: hypothetical protein HQL56_16295 [Magnetococcales bacterium]|nr:hypothetical protein [Magnetococcales bacterium]